MTAKDAGFITTSPLRKFQTEVARLRSLYLLTMYSFRVTRAGLIDRITSGTIDPHAALDAVQRLGESGDRGTNAFQALHKMKSLNPRYLRETLFVRLISALEVFLLDTVRDVFLARRDLFHSEKKFEISYGELLTTESITELWSKLINRDLRRLQSQGFKDIVRFFRSVLRIDLSATGVSLVALEAFHDRRHILVHRLGRTDDEYRHRYRTYERSITVSEDYLLESLETLSGFSKAVAELVVRQLADVAGAIGGRSGRYEVRVVVDSVTEEGDQVVNREFQFVVDDRIARLGDLLVAGDRQGWRQSLLLRGHIRTIHGYLRILKRAKRGALLTIVGAPTFKRIAVAPSCDLPEQTINAVREALPPKPLPYDIHRVIAQQFGISEREAYGAIGIIVEGEKAASLSQGSVATPASPEEVRPAKREDAPQ